MTTIDVNEILLMFIIHSFWEIINNLIHEMINNADALMHWCTLICNTHFSGRSSFERLFNLFWSSIRRQTEDFIEILLELFCLGHFLRKIIQRVCVCVRDIDHSHWRKTANSHCTNEWLQKLFIFKSINFRKTSLDNKQTFCSAIERIGWQRKQKHTECYPLPFCDNNKFV